jgi:hypothetical protein
MNMNINVDDLTHRQAIFLEVITNCGSIDAGMKFYDSLPTAEMRKDALIAIDALSTAIMDIMINNGHAPSEHAVAQAISRAKY